jgi:recombinational DNA repair ATPase RecF
MSELDADRRRLLVERVAAGGQCLITTTDLGPRARSRRECGHAHRRERRRGAQEAVAA